MIKMNDLIEINMLFDKGRVINESSLDFAIAEANATKDWIKQLAYLTRAILIDHAFEEGNKRTAAALIKGMVDVHKLACDMYKVDSIIIKIIKENIADINKIRRLIKNAIE